MSIKTDCYWYDEWKDMNASLPCCKLTNDDILDSCDGCKHYHSKYNPTNADLIRKMNDEELARWINNEFSKYNLYNEWLEWLRKEV